MMRSLVVAIALLAFISQSTAADAKPRRAKKSVATKSEKSTKKRAKHTDKSSRKRKRVAMGTRKHPRFELRVGPRRGSSRQNVEQVDVAAALGHPKERALELRGEQFLYLESLQP